MVTITRADRSDPASTSFSHAMRAVLMLLIMSFSGLTLAANITASVDRNPVTVDESFTLILKADGEPDDDPDLSPLSDDFEVLGTSQSTSMNFINGVFERSSSWNISLIAKRTGSLTLPSIRFGSDRSPSLRINVREGTASPGSAADNLFLEAEVDTDRTWVQGQVVYTLRLFRNVEINSASLTPPRTSDPDAIIEKLGDDIAYESFRNGVRYDVIERRFAIFPQQSGTLTIAPTVFEGRTGLRRSFFDTRQGSDRIRRLRSPQLLVTIDPIPTTMTPDAWIPATQLNIVDEWSTPLDSLTAGEPVTRTLSISADGVLASQLPMPAFSEIEGIKQYPDQPKNDQRYTRDGISSTKQIKLALIPATEGRYTIPELRLPWWNARSGQREVAIIPAQEIVVMPSATAPAQTRANPDVTAPVNDVIEAPVAVTTDAPGVWPWVSLLLATGWLLTVIALLRKRSATPDRSRSLSASRKRLIKACDDNDARACRQALIDWAGGRWPERRINNLMDITPLLDETVADQLRALNSALYSEHAENWRGAELSRSIQAMPLKEGSHISTMDPVEPLYRH